MKSRYEQELLCPHCLCIVEVPVGWKDGRVKCPICGRWFKEEEGDIHDRDIPDQR